MFMSKLLSAFLKGLTFPMCLMLGAVDGGTSGSPTGEVGSTGAAGENGSATLGSSSASEGAAKTFTQDDVSRIAAREKAEGRRSLLKELGIEDNEDAKQAIRDYLQQQENQKSEAEKALARATKAEKDKLAAEAIATGYQRKFDAMAAGAKSETVEDLIALTCTKVNDKTDFKAALELVKKSYPVFFNDGDSGQKSAHGTGRSTNPPKGASGQMSMGERLARTRLDNAPKDNPFFKNNF